MLSLRIVRHSSAPRTIYLHPHAFPDESAPAVIASLESENGVTAVHDGTMSVLTGPAKPLGWPGAC
jgi:hypothetical protein